MTATDPSPSDRPTKAARSSSPKKQPLRLVAIVVAAAAVVAVALWGSEGGRVKKEFAALAQLRADGQVEHAMADITRLRDEWAKSSDDRLQRLADEEAQLNAIVEAERALVTQINDPELERSLAAWTVELQRIENQGAAPERIAAGRVLGKVDSLLKAKPKPKKAPAPAPVPTPTPSPRYERPAPVATPVAPPPVATNEAAKPAAVDTPAAAAPSIAATIAEAKRLTDKGLFVQSLALLRDALANADAAVTAPLQKEMDAVKAAAQTALTSLLAGAERSLTNNRPREAVTVLAAARHRFPTTPEFQPLQTAIQKAEAAVAAKEAADEEAAEIAEAAKAGIVLPPKRAAAPAAKPATDEPASATQLRAQMDRIRSAEERGAFADAARDLREVATLARATDPAFAERLEGRAAEADLLAAWHDAVAASLAAGRTVKVVSTAGRAVRLVAAQGAELAGSAGGESVRLTWNDVSALGLQLLTDVVQPTGDGALGAATLFYRLADRERAEALLAKVLQSDAALKPRIDGVLARGRGEPVDARGYSLGRDGFVSLRSLDLQKEAQKMLPKIEAALAEKDGKSRDKVIDEIAAGGAETTAILVQALKKQFDQRVAKISASNIDKQLARLGEQRVLLDKARADAKGLIYDEVKYFYPYNPPAVSGEKHAEYVKVQAEVNRLVDAVRVLWNDDRIKVRIPATLRADVERAEWLASRLFKLGALDARAVARLEWVRTIPSGDTVGIRDYCVSADEREELEGWRKIEAYNALMGKKVSSSVRELLEITNAYRTMFRHRPVAVVKQLDDAAQGHADEMAKLGYMAHMSPTPGRETPYDRMQLAGYTAGVSENLALHDGALGAHNGWCGSSGHHRNLLDPGHTELGIGSNGRLWVQNFGRGLVHRETPEWKQLMEGGSR